MFLTTFKDICMVHLIDMGIPYSFSFNYYLLKKITTQSLYSINLYHMENMKKSKLKKKKKTVAKRCDIVSFALYVQIKIESTFIQSRA